MAALSMSSSEPALELGLAEAAFRARLGGGADFTASFELAGRGLALDVAVMVIGSMTRVLFQ
jgi:hypothetical protein